MQRMIPALPLLSLVAVLAAHRPALDPAQGQAMAPAPAEVSSARTSTGIRIVVQGVEVRCTVSLLEELSSATGPVRPAALAVNFLRGRVLLGTLNTLEAPQAWSSEPLDLALQGLDLRLADPEVAEAVARRSYRVLVQPRDSLTWSQVGNADDDLLVTVHPTE
jgi:hypothetical protein